ncbi:hypothetical protein OPQ81_005693 [Rhizoctonia solani]|nr:hypothetical protein OPQ81_005693 [Rhizoctonia solani]
MHISASFVALVTLMMVARTTAAPTGVNPSPGLPFLPAPDSPHAPHVRRSHGVAPVSGFKLSNRMTPAVNTCGCKPVSTVNSTADVAGKTKDGSKAVQDTTNVPDAHTHCETDVNKGGDTTDTRPESHTQSQPPPKTQPQSHPLPLSQASGDCLNSSRIHDGLPTNACVTVNPEDGKGGLDVAHNSAHNAGDIIQATPDIAIDHVHQVSDKPMDTAHDVAFFDRPNLTVAKEGTEGMSQGICIYFMA